MKKTFIALGCCAILAGCGNNADTNANNENEQVRVYNDSTSDAEVSAATKQSEVDTSINNIGTDRTPIGSDQDGN